MNKDSNNNEGRIRLTFVSSLWFLSLFIKALSVTPTHTHTHTYACNDMIRVDLMRLWGNWKRAQQFHCHTHSRAHQYNHLQTLMTCEEAKVGGHRRAKDAEGTKEGRRKTDNKDSNKENVSVFLLFFALSGSGLVWSGPLFSLSYTHTHACVCFLSVSLCENRKEKKKLLNPWMILRYIWIFPLSLHREPVCIIVSIPFFEGQINRFSNIYYILHNID